MSRIRTASVVLVALLVLAGPVLSAPDQQEHFIVELPLDLPTFQEVAAEWSKTPQGATALTVLALNVYAADQELGARCLSVAVHPKWQDLGDDGAEGLQLRNRYLQSLKTNVAARPFVARSYVKGTSPENGYQLPEGPLTITVRWAENAVTEKEGRLFVPSSGADSDRPVTVKVDDEGRWRAWTWNSLELGVRPPEGK